MSAEFKRRDLLGASAAAAGLALAGCRKDAVETFIKTRLVEMDEQQLKDYLAGLEKRYTSEFGKQVRVDATQAQDGVLFAYGLDLDRCNGNRKCVEACVDENNQSRGNGPDGRHQPIEWIEVFEIPKSKGIDLDHGDKYFDREQVPDPNSFYLPVACQQCDNPSCVKVCPVEATWKEPDGIVVIDYDWCIGCRCCMSACPYGARHFNWADPHLPAEEMNPNTHVCGNRPRPRGVVEKCTFCIHRTRKGQYPACHDACPTGARVFGNLLDPASEIRQLIHRKRVYILKAELNTRPSFFYFYG
jgi:molybdopterin-containing oxidoreductase family iron-sulfur binding subunit